jgi:general secretion pathway protein G
MKKNVCKKAGLIPAFTMIEIVFVITVIGILASVAMPRLSATRDDAVICKGRNEVASLRSAIASVYQTGLLRGARGYVSRLDGGVSANVEGVMIFDTNDTASQDAAMLLSYGVTTKEGDGRWMKTEENRYTFRVNHTEVHFGYFPQKTTLSGNVYRAGTFTCKGLNSANAAKTYCKALIE